MDNEILIPKEQIPTGVKFCIANANRLLEDAKHCIKNQSYPSSIVLSTIAYEEIGKAIKLRDMWIEGKNITRQDWMEVKDHINKSDTVNKFVFNNLPNLSETFKQEEFQKLLRFEAETKSKKDKESYMYVDWINNNWSSPIIPRMLPPDSDPIQWMDGISKWKMEEVKIALDYFLRDEKSKLIQQAPTPNIITDIEIRQLLRERLGRTKDQMGISIKTHFGKIKRISIDWVNPPLTEEQQTTIRIEISRLFPKLKEFVIRNKAKPKT